MPIGCTVGATCFIQQYVDRAPGPDVRDYQCGAETYDSHRGVDIRVRSAADVEKGFAVLAAAQGVVVGVRDGMADHFVRTEEERRGVAGRDCGNGVRLDHGQGWHTQYCHLRSHSVKVKNGDVVVAGTKLGEVGYSGNAAFPHLHFQVSRNDLVVDPFLPDSKVICGTGWQTLWTESAMAALTYQRGSLLALGLTDHAVTLQELETGAPRAVSEHAPIVAYVWAINLQKDDTIEIELDIEQKILARSFQKLDHDKAQFLLFAGKGAPAQGWPKGVYTAIVKVTRGASPLMSESNSIDLK